jgi:DNA-binding response OmpR family regulator
MIDDDLDMVSSVRTVMESAGWEVSSAANGAEGVERARELLPDLIIVLTSVSEKLGFSFSAADMADHYGHQPEAFLQKPFEPQRLIQTAERLTRPRG